MTKGTVVGEQIDATDGRPITDPIGLALTAIGAGAAAGACAITLGVLALRFLQGGDAQAAATSADFTLLSTAVMVGPVVTVTVTMLATRRIDDLWRRAVAAAIAVFCAFLLAGIAAPLDLLAGRAGLVAFAAGLLGITVHLARRAHRIGLQ